MHLRDLKISPRSEHKALGASRRRGRQPRARKRRPTIRFSNRAPAHLPELKQAAEPASLARPYCREWPVPTSRSSTSWTRSIPSTGELIPAQPDGYLTANHLWDAADRQIKLQAARNEFVAFQILLRGDIPAGSIKPELVFDGPAGKTIQVAMGRYHPVAARRGPDARPDRAAELRNGKRSADQESKPARRDLCPARAAARRVSRHADAQRSGPRPRFVCADQETLRLPVSLRVWDFSLPDHLSFLPEMNCYGLPEDELDYYRLAHRHRTVLNRVPYNQNGRMAGRLRTGLGQPAIEAGLVELGPPVRSAAGRVGVRRSAAQERAGRVLLPPPARELAQPDGRKLQRRLLGRSCLPGFLSPGFCRCLAGDRRAPCRPGNGTRRSSRAS